MQQRTEPYRLSCITPMYIHVWQIADQSDLVTKSPREMPSAGSGRCHGIRGHHVKGAEQRNSDILAVERKAYC